MARSGPRRFPRRLPAGSPGVCQQVPPGSGAWFPSLTSSVFEKIRNVVFSENKKCCLQSEQRELIQYYSNLKHGGGTLKSWFWIEITKSKSFFAENMKWSHGPYGHFGCGTLAHTCNIFHFVENRKIWKLVPPKGRPPGGQTKLLNMNLMIVVCFAIFYYILNILWCVLLYFIIFLIYFCVFCYILLYFWYILLYFYIKFT